MTKTEARKKSWRSHTTRAKWRRPINLVTRLLRTSTYSMRLYRTGEGVNTIFWQRTRRVCVMFAVETSGGTVPCRCPQLQPVIPRSGEHNNCCQMSDSPLSCWIGTFSRICGQYSDSTMTVPSEKDTRQSPFFEEAHRFGRRVCYGDSKILRSAAN